MSAESLLSGTLKTLLDEFAYAIARAPRDAFGKVRPEDNTEPLAARLALEEYVERRTLTDDEAAYALGVLQSHHKGLSDHRFGLGVPTILKTLLAKLQSISGRSTESGVPK